MTELQRVVIVGNGQVAELALARLRRDTALQVWWRQALGLIAVGGLTLLVILGSAVVASRSLRWEEAARTERDEAQAVVARREQELSVIFRSVQELLFRADVQGRLSFLNLRRDPLTDEPIDQLIGLPLHRIVTEHGLERRTFPRVRYRHVGLGVSFPVQNPRTQKKKKPIFPTENLELDQRAAEG